jgi:hypothetical protein
MSSSFSQQEFYARMQREHRALNFLTGRIRAVFRQCHDLAPGQHVSPRLIDALEELRDHLGMLFALEEAHDGSPEVLALAGRLSRTVSQLQTEHRELFTELCRTIDYSEEAFCHRQLDDLLERIEHRFNGFYEHFLAHEAHENDLILQALDDDLGTGD